MYDFKAKDKNVKQNNEYMLAKTLSMFEYENLPESIPPRELEKLLQVNGYAFITEVDGVLYAFNGGLGGVPDVYGNHTEITITNPSLKFNKTLNLVNDGVLIRSDDLAIGLIPLFNKYHSMMVENDINLILNGYNSRLQTLISASDDSTKLSAETYLKKLVDGEIGVIGETALFEGVKTHSPSSNSGTSITSLIEFQQYTKATLYNEIGLSANFNMKRERLSSSEVELAEDSLFPFVDNMMKNRLKAVKELNDKYNLNLKVGYGSVWYNKSKELVDDIVKDELLNENVGGDLSNNQLETSLNISGSESLNESLDESLSESTNESSQEPEVEQGVLELDSEEQEQETEPEPEPETELDSEEQEQETEPEPEQETELDSEEQEQETEQEQEPEPELETEEQEEEDDETK